MQYITRHEHGAVGTHYWKVTIRRQKRNYIRNFADQRHGGKDQAFVAAQAYREAVLADHPLMTRQARCAIVRKDNRSGVPGVTRRPKHLTQAAYWVARWPGEGKTIKQRRFSVMTYGETGAFLKAVEARRHGLATMDESSCES